MRKEKCRLQTSRQTVSVAVLASGNLLKVTILKNVSAGVRKLLTHQCNHQLKATTLFRDAGEADREDCIAL